MPTDQDLWNDKAVCFDGVCLQQVLFYTEQTNTQTPNRRSNRPSSLELLSQLGAFRCEVMTSGQCYTLHQEAGRDGDYGQGLMLCKLQVRRYFSAGLKI
jgi:hypothetical protein